MPSRTITEISHIQLLDMIKEFEGLRKVGLNYAPAMSAKYGEERVNLFINVLKLMNDRKIHCNDFARVVLWERDKGKKGMELKISGRKDLKIIDI